jgi:hypothetical protein
VLGAAIAGLPLLWSGRYLPLGAVIGGLALALLALALVLRPGALPWALALLALEVVVLDLVHDEPAALVPLCGAGLLLASECSYTSIELRRRREERPERRVPRLLAVAAGGLAAAFVPFTAVGLSGPSGLAAELLTVAAAIALLAAPALLLSRRVLSGRASAAPRDR